jgi:general stress protein 26
MTDLMNYEQVSIYRLDSAMQDRLLSIGRECVFNWSTSDGWPMGVIMSYLWSDGRVWLTAGAHRHRIEAVRNRPRVSVVVSSTGTELGSGKTVTVKGRCIVHEDAATKRWFYPALSQHLNADAKRAAAFEKMLDSPLRVVLEVVPEKYITYDGAKMFAHTAGKLSEADLAPPLSSDTVRLRREIERRGL